MIEHLLIDLLAACSSLWRNGILVICPCSRRASLSPHLLPRWTFMQFLGLNLGGGHPQPCTVWGCRVGASSTHVFSFPFSPLPGAVASPLEHSSRDRDLLCGRLFIRLSLWGARRLRAPIPHAAFLLTDLSRSQKITHPQSGRPWLRQRYPYSLAFWIAPSKHVVSPPCRRRCYLMGQHRTCATSSYYTNVLGRLAQQKMTLPSVSSTGKPPSPQALTLGELIRLGLSGRSSLEKCAALSTDWGDDAQTDQHPTLGPQSRKILILFPDASRQKRGAPGAASLCHVGPPGGALGGGGDGARRQLSGPQRGTCKVRDTEAAS